EPLAAQLDGVVSLAQKLHGGELGEPFGEFRSDVDAELAAEVADVEASGFELQDHLSDKPLLWRRRQSAVQRQLPAVEHGDVVFPAIDILQVDPVEVAEGGDAGAEHISSMPQGVAVDEAAAAAILHQGVGAGDLIPCGEEGIEGVADPGPLGGPVRDLD